MQTEVKMCKLKSQSLPVKQTSTPVTLDPRPCTLHTKFYIPIPKCGPQQWSAINCLLLMERVTTACYGVATPAVRIVSRNTITRCSDALCKLKKKTNLESQILPNKVLNPGPFTSYPKRYTLNSKYEPPKP